MVIRGRCGFNGSSFFFTDFGLGFTATVLGVLAVRIWFMWFTSVVRNDSTIFSRVFGLCLAIIFCIADMSMLFFFMAARCCLYPDLAAREFLILLCNLVCSAERSIFSFRINTFGETPLKHKYSIPSVVARSQLGRS